MAYDLNEDSAFTTMAAKNIAEGGSDIYKMIAKTLDCNLANAVACVGLLAVEKAGRYMPTDIYFQLYDATPERTAFMAKLRASLLE